VRFAFPADGLSQSVVGAAAKGAAGCTASRVWCNPWNRHTRFCLVGVGLHREEHTGGAKLDEAHDLCIVADRDRFLIGVLGLIIPLAQLRVAPVTERQSYFREQIDFQVVRAWIQNIATIILPDR
jgi:hypothetical protein